MPPLPSLQKIREAIRETMAANLAAQSNGDNKPLHNALAYLPESSMWSLVIWMHEIQLPKIALHRGVESEEYLNYTAIRDAIIWSLHIAEQYQNALAKQGRDMQQLGYYIEQNQKLQQELNKYATVEQLITTDSFGIYRQALVSRALSIIEQKK